MNPAAEARQQIHGPVEIILFDPGSGIVGGIPQRTGVGQLQRVGGSAAIIMFVEIIQDALVVRRVVSGHLLQIILSGVQIILLRRSSDPAAQREIHRAKNFRRGIGLLDHGRILLAEADDRVVIGLHRFHVAMRVAPAAGLVVQLVVGHAAIRGGPESGDQVLDPALLQRHGVVDVIGVNVGVEQLGAVGGDAVSAIVAVGMDVGIGRLLRAIHRNRKAAAPRRGFIHPRNNRNGHQGVRVRRRLVRVDHQVGGRAGNGGGFAVAAHEIPVKTGVTRIDLPVVARGAVATPANIGNLNFLGERRVEPVVRDAINIGIDRMGITGRVYGESWRRSLGVNARGRNQCHRRKQNQRGHNMAAGGANRAAVHDGSQGRKIEELSSDGRS